MPVKSVTLIAVAQRLADIRTAEQRLAVLIQDADLTKRGVGKGL